jgi:4-carboxymuconolactone decarboxylase
MMAEKPPNLEELAAKYPPTAEVIRKTAAFAPWFAKVREEFIRGYVWEQPELSKRERSLITIALDIALRREEPIAGHIMTAVDQGITREEISALCLHVSIYAGFPAGGFGIVVAHDVFEALDALEGDVDPSAGAKP